MITRIFTLTVVGLLSLAALSEACGRRGRGSGGCSGGGCSGGGCSTGFSYGGGGCSSGGCSTGNCANGQCGYVGGITYQPTSYFPSTNTTTTLTGGCGMPGCICPTGNCPADCAANGCTCGMAGALGAAGSNLIKVKVCDNLSCRIATVPVSAVPCQWKPVPNAPTQVAKYVGGVQVGSYDEQSMIFRDYNAATQAWGATTSYAATESKAAPPVVKPIVTPAGSVPTTTPATGTTATQAEATKEKAATGVVIGSLEGNDLKAWQTSGVGWVPPAENTHWENGVKTAESKLMNAGSDVPDLSKRGRIVVVDEDVARGKSIARDLATSKRGANSDVQYFAPSAWQVKPWKLDQDETFRNTHLAMLEMGPVEADGRGAAIHAEYTPEGIVAFGRKADPAFRLSSVPTSETAGMDDAFTILAAIGVVAALVFAALWPANKPAPVQPEGEVSWSY